MKVNRKKWTPEDDAYLRRSFATASKHDLMEKLNRTWLSISNRACKLGLTRPGYRQQEWTKEEDQKLKRFYPKGAKEEILKALARWNWDAICRRAKHIGVKRNLSNVHSVRKRKAYSQEEIEYLQQNFEKGLKEDIITRLGNRRWETIAAYARRILGLQRDRELAYTNRVNPITVKHSDYLTVDNLKKITEHTRPSSDSKQQFLSEVLDIYSSLNPVAGFNSLESS